MGEAARLLAAIRRLCSVTAPNPKGPEPPPASVHDAVRLADELIHETLSYGDEPTPISLVVVAGQHRIDFAFGTDGVTLSGAIPRGAGGLRAVLAAVLERIGPKAEGAGLESGE